MPPENGGQAAGYSHLTDGTTSHSTRLPKDGSQVAGYKLANYANQVIGYSPSTDETPSHSTRLLKDSNQVAGYRLSAEELLMELLAIPLGCQRTTAKWLVMAGHPKDDCQVASMTLSKGYGSILAKRNPKLLKRSAGSLLSRTAARTFRGSLFHEPPRSTRFSPSPCHALPSAGAPL